MPEQREIGDRRSLERIIDRIGWRLDALDEWRKEVDKRVSVLESNVETERQTRLLNDALRSRDIADAVSQKLRNDASFGITTVQKIGALLLGLLVAAGTIKGLL